MLIITCVDERYLITFNDCVIYATTSLKEAKQWLEDHQNEYL